MAHSVLTMILAGGKGTRLEPLTRDRAKPAVPFGGQYRIIDFALSNCINSGLRRVLLLTQYKSGSLNRHIDAGWKFLCRDLGEYIDVVAPQQRLGEHWYRGTADAIYQNIYYVEKESPTHVLILGGDHIYKMNYGPMIDFHASNNADVTVACVPVDLAQASRFGVLETNDAQRIMGFEEKPAAPRPMPGDAARALCSMGIYVFNTDYMCEWLVQDAVDAHSSRDFGKNLIPAMIQTGRVFAYPFRDENRKTSAYWRDVGTIDEYYAANMDLVQVDPVLNLYDRDWPIRTAPSQEPPPKFVFGEPGQIGAARRGEAIDSIVCAGGIVSGGQVARSIVGRRVRVNSYARVEDSILFENVNIGRHARVRRAIIDKDVFIPAGDEIGFDHEKDRARGFTVSENGVVVIAKAEQLDAQHSAMPKR